MNEYLLAAATSYFIFEDARARLAAVVSGLTNAGDARDSVVAVLLAIEQMPDTMALLFLSATDSGREPIPSGTSTREWASAIRTRAGHIRSDMSRLADVRLVTLRQQLFKEAPDYEHALGGVTKSNPRDLFSVATRRPETHHRLFHAEQVSEGLTPVAADAARWVAKRRG